MGCSGLERDDVGALANSVDVASICGVPERCGMALVGFRGKEELEGDVGGRRRMAQEGMWLVVGGDVAAQMRRYLLWRLSAMRQQGGSECVLTLLLVELILFRNGHGGGLGRSCSSIIGWYRMVGVGRLSVDLGLY